MTLVTKLSLSLSLLVVALSSVVAYAHHVQPAKVLRVIAGDTVEITADWIIQPLDPKLSLRVLGIDTPEKGFLAKCGREIELGLKAAEYTTAAVATAKKIRVDIQGWGKYGGSVLGELYLDGRPLSQLLINEGLAVKYNGRAKKSWCD